MLSLPPLPLLTRVAAAVVVLELAVLSAPSLSAQETTLQPGKAYFDADKHVEFQVGALPIILTSPHGGRLKPGNIRDRTEGVLQMDANTQELTREINAEFIRRTGRPPHVIISLLHRSKLDPNRAIGEAAQGDPIAEKAWHQFHGCIKTAARVAVEQHGFAFLVDVHGHGHTIPRIELGYAIDGAHYNQSDRELDDADLGSASTLNDLHASAGGSFAELIRGPRSLGGLLQAAGYRSVPSPRDPGPGKFPYFNGGYIVRTYAVRTQGVDGVQIECHRPGVRETAAERKRFAKAMVDALIVFLEERYRYSIVPAAKASLPAEFETAESADALAESL